jgi:hypothetical protein
MAQTLEELKAENVAAEVEVDTPPQEVEAEVEVEAVEVEAVESDEIVESNDDETEETKTEDWMQSDEPESQADKKYSGEDIGNAKAKLRSKLDRKHNTETDELKAEIERLKNGRVDAKGLNKPKRDDFYESDDPDEAFFEALTDWKMEQNQAKAATRSKQSAEVQRAEEFKTNVSKGVDQHYERAVVLAENSGISPELYQSADLKVRQAVESIFPNAGDVITDSLITNLGAGSEKVFYNLGVNTTKRNEFTKLLTEDTSGMKAAMYLGKLQAELVAPTKRKTNAPSPAANVSGDAQSGSDPFKASKKAYDKASKSGDTQAAFNARMKARKAGANVTNW